jgi:hypothetical protein
MFTCFSCYFPCAEVDVPACLPISFGILWWWLVGGLVGLVGFISPLARQRSCKIKTHIIPGLSRGRLYSLFILSFYLLISKEYRALFGFPKGP